MQFLKYKTFVLFLLILGIDKINAQTYNSVIPDKDIESFIQWKLQDTSAYRTISREYFSDHILEWKREILDCSDSKWKGPFCIYNTQNNWLDSILTKEDKIYFQQQADSIKSATWLFRNIKFADKKTLKKNSCFLSTPLFSQNKQFAILRELYKCGPGCGQMRILIYKRTESGWEYFRLLSGSVI